MTLEQRAEECEGLSHNKLWGRMFWTTETVSTRTLRWEWAWNILEPAKASVATAGPGIWEPGQIIQGLWNNRKSVDVIRIAQGSGQSCFFWLAISPDLYMEESTPTSAWRRDSRWPRVEGEGWVRRCFSIQEDDLVEWIKGLVTAIRSGHFGIQIEPTELVEALDMR